MFSPSKKLYSLCAADIMSANIVMVPREMSLQGAARMLDRARVTGAPVVDAQGRCIGVLSATDFMHLVEDEHRFAGVRQETTDDICSAWQIPECAEESCGCVERLMTKDPVVVDPATPIAKLAQMMIDAHIHRLIVADPVSNKALGIVSSMDILAALSRLDPVRDAAPEPNVNEVHVGAFE